MESCDNCGWQQEYLHGDKENGDAYCDVCYSSGAYRALQYNYPDQPLHATLAFCTNLILKALAKPVTIDD